MDEQKFDPIMYVFLNKDLHMSVGKAAAQAVHAAMMADIRLNTTRTRDIWETAPHKTVIVLEGRNELHMKTAGAYLFERGIDSYYVIDEGVNEIDPHVVTAMATGILNKNDEKMKDTLSTFSLYREIMRFKVEFER